MTATESSPRIRSQNRWLWPRHRSLLERLLDRTGKRKQTLLDDDRHFADEAYRLATLLENARPPFDSIGQVVDPALVGVRSILKLTKLEDRGPDLVRKFLLFAKIALNPLHHFAAFMIEGLEQSSKYQFRLFLPLGLGAGDDI